MTINPNTHLAAEFHVLSCLHRKGIDAHLTMGNHKSVDILIKKVNGRTITIDVKGVRNGGWRLGTNVPTNTKSHYYVLVNYRGSIEEPNQCPEVYIVPSSSIIKFQSYSEKGGYGVNYKELQNYRSKFLNKWKPLM